jgi:diguanylate cyclase (GGDEF)-like protein
MDTLLTTINFATAVLSSVIAAVAWRFRSLRGANELMYSMLCISFWLIAGSLSLLTANFEDKVLWSKLSYLGVVSVPPLWLMFSARVTRNPKWLTPGLNALLFVIPAITLTLLLTTDVVLHEFRFNPDIPGGLTSSIGPWWGAHLLYSYGTLLGGTALLARAWTQHRGVYRSQLGTWMLSMAVPFGFNVLLQTPWFPVRSLDLTPAALAVCGLLILNGVLRHRLLSLEPVALEGAVDNMRDGFIVLDDDGRVVRANPAAANAFHTPLSDAPGEHASRVLIAWTTLEPAMRASTEQTTTVSAQLGDRDLEYQISPVRNWRQHLVAFVLIVRDVTEVRRYQERMAEFAYRDALTGLDNRRALFDRGANLLEACKQNSQTCAVLYVDLDGFKAINDRLGHNVGDRVLERVAGRLQEITHVNAVVARNGGDEFVIVVEADEKTAHALAQRLQASVVTPILHDGKELRVGCSTGVSLFPRDGMDLETLLRAADAAMYAEKRGKVSSR